jgi:hypothetical protein
MEMVNGLRSIDADSEARNEAVFSASREADESNYNKNSIDYRSHRGDIPAEEDAASLLYWKENSHEKSSTFRRGRNIPFENERERGGLGRWERENWDVDRSH